MSVFSHHPPPLPQRCNYVITRHLLAFGDDPVSLNEKCMHVDVGVQCVNVDVDLDEGYIDVDSYFDIDISFVNVYVDFDVLQDGDGGVLANEESPRLSARFLWAHCQLHAKVFFLLVG